MTPSRSRSGMTLIEVAVVIGIVGLLLAILIPAVQSAREAARRVECRSRLGQLGLALHNFAATEGVFPVGVLGEVVQVGTTESELRSHDDYSPQARLLPYLDQTPLFNRINFQTRGAISPAQPLHDPATQSVPTLHCPSDPVTAGNNYRVCTGETAYAMKENDPGDRGGSGAFEVLRKHGPADFTDGLGNTVGVSEKIKAIPDRPGWSSGAFWYSGISGFLGYNPTTETVVRTCGGISADPPAEMTGTHAGATWMYAHYDFTFYNHTVTPNSTVRDCSLMSHQNRQTIEAYAGVFAARSYHRGGVNVMLMDGSCRFVSDSIDLGVWRALSTRAGGETLGEY